MRLLLVLAFLCRLVSSNMCVVCQPGKYNTMFSSLPCQSCEENTYAPNAGMTTCLPCVANSTANRSSAKCTCVSGYVWSNDSISCVSSCPEGLVMLDTGCGCAVGSLGPSGGPCVCDKGFARSATGNCIPTSNTFLVLKFEMTLAIPPNATTTDVQDAVASSVSVAYGVPKENLEVTVTVLPPTRRRMLLQDGVRFAVQVRIIFPSDVSLVDVTVTQTRLSAINSTQLEAGLQTAPNVKQFRVLESGSVEIIIISATPTTSPVPSTSRVLSTPNPSPSPSDSTGLTSSDIIVIGVSVGFVLVLACACILICLCRSTHSRGD